MSQQWQKYLNNIEYTYNPIQLLLNGIKLPQVASQPCCGELMNPCIIAFLFDLMRWAHLSDHETGVDTVWCKLNTVIYIRFSCFCVMFPFACSTQGLILIKTKQTENTSHMDNLLFSAACVKEQLWTITIPDPPYTIYM